jgi:hypothetical protein
MLFADECFFAGDRSHAGILKALATEKSLMIEPKGFPAFPVPNYLHIFMASNNDWVVPASLLSRRFFVLDVLPLHQGDRAYFNALWRQMEHEGGLAAMLHDLLKRDLGDWHPRQIIRTPALRDQQLLSLDSLDPHDAWWLTLLSDGLLPGYQGRVTVTEMKDPDVPGFDRATMDGYAVMAESSRAVRGGHRCFLWRKCSSRQRGSNWLSRSGESFRVPWPEIRDARRR